MCVGLFMNKEVMPNKLSLSSLDMASFDLETCELKYYLPLTQYAHGLGNMKRAPFLEVGIILWSSPDLAP